MFQKIQTKQKGFRCEIQVPNHSGHDVLTTYDPDVDNSVEIATKDLQDFFNECIDEFGNRGRRVLKPNVFGRKQGAEFGDMELIDPIAPDFDLGLYEQILVQPVPLVGG